MWPNMHTQNEIPLALPEGRLLDMHEEPVYVRWRPYKEGDTGLKVKKKNLKGDIKGLVKVFQRIKAQRL